MGNEWYVVRRRVVNATVGQGERRASLRASIPAWKMLLCTASVGGCGVTRFAGGGVCFKEAGFRAT